MPSTNPAATATTSAKRIPANQLSVSPSRSQIQMPWQQVKIDAELTLQSPTQRHPRHIIHNLHPKHLRRCRPQPQHQHANSPYLQTADPSPGGKRKDGLTKQLLPHLPLLLRPIPNSRLREPPLRDYPARPASTHQPQPLPSPPVCIRTWRKDGKSGSPSFAIFAPLKAEHDTPNSRSITSAKMCISAPLTSTPCGHERLGQLSSPGIPYRAS